MNRNVRPHLPLIALTFAVIADRIITVRYWHLETNPFVMGLSPVEWILLSIGLIVSLTAVWFHFNLYELRGARWYVTVIALFHNAILLGNVMVIRGFL